MLPVLTQKKKVEPINVIIQLPNCLPLRLKLRYLPIFFVTYIPTYFDNIDKVLIKYYITHNKNTYILTIGT